MDRSSDSDDQPGPSGNSRPSTPKARRRNSTMSTISLDGSIPSPQRCTISSLPLSFPAPILTPLLLYCNSTDLFLSISRHHAKRVRMEESSTSRPYVPLPIRQDTSDSQTQESPSDIGPPRLPSTTSSYSSAGPSSSDFPVGRFAKDGIDRHDLIRMGIPSGKQVSGGALSLTSAASPATSERPPVPDFHHMVESPRYIDDAPSEDMERPSSQGSVQASHTSRGSTVMNQDHAGQGSTTESGAGGPSPPVDVDEDQSLDPGLDPRSYTPSSRYVTFCFYLSGVVDP